MATPVCSPKFLFVDGRDKQGRGVQSFINSRRLKNDALKRNLATRSKAPVGWAKQPLSEFRTSDVTLQNISPNCVATSQVSNDTTSDDMESLQHTYPAPSPEVEVEHTLARSQPSQSLSASIECELIHVDPFASLPIQLDESSQALYRFSIDFLTEDQFAETFTNPALTRSLGLWTHYNSYIRACASLAMASTHLDRVRRAGTSNLTIKWKFNLIQCLNRVISNEATRYGDDALNGVVLLLLFEAITPRSQQLHLHSRALKQLLSKRGSRGYLSDHVDVGLAVLTSKAQIAYLDHLQPGLAGIQEAWSWKAEVDFTLTTLRGLCDWVLQKLRDFYRNPILQNSLFLRSLQRFEQPTDTFEQSQQIFALCYIAVALLEAQDVPECIRFLQTLSVYHEQLDSARPLSNTVWACIRGTWDSKDLQFQAIRLTRVFHRLTDETQLVLRRFLKGICGVVCGSSKGGLLTEQDYTTIHQEALAGLPCG